jgi:hypothetical protein
MAQEIDCALDCTKKVTWLKAAGTEFCWPLLSKLSFALGRPDTRGRAGDFLDRPCARRTVGNQVGCHR